MRKRVALLLLALLPPFAIARANQRWVDRVGTDVGRDLAVAVAELPRPKAPEPDPVFVEANEEAANLAADSGKRGDKARAGKGKAAKAPKRRGVFVPAPVVLRLAEARAMPRAIPVAANGPRPAGLRLIGVGGLGVGMRDGDVLTRVLGGGVGSVADVVARVIAARERRAPQISAEFWRDGEAWSLVVEQPYVNPAAQP